PSTLSNQLTPLTFPLPAMEGQLPRASVLPRFVDSILNQSLPILSSCDGRIGSTSRAFARAGEGNGGTQRRPLDFMGGVEHGSPCGSGCDRGTAFGATRERGHDESNRSVRSMELLPGQKHQGYRARCK